MASLQSLPWAEPLELASTINDDWCVLLYSGTQASYSGRYSYLAHHLAEKLEGGDFSALEGRLGTDAAPHENQWFGYLGYGLKNSLETLPQDQPGWFRLPPLCMMRFHCIYIFDHEQRRLTRWTDQPGLPVLSGSRAASALPEVARIGSPMTRAEYLAKAAEVIEAIHRGDLYQANLTRKFTGEFTQPPEPFSLFRQLCATSPAPYSAFLKLGDRSVLSSSPEMFLQMDAQGMVRARPIKGTSPRFSDQARDRESFDHLAASAKDKAENLMIADLMRNDLSKTCLPGSVKAERLFEVTAHATIHHMSSTITGQRRPGCAPLETVKHCFPPGSMTGAPKIEAMKLCSRLEGLERGVYSGAIGWFSGDGSAELSVVIRTLLLEGSRFEFQVGGGIVADSTPEKEEQEILDKAAGILRVLGLSPQDLGR